MLNVYTAIVFKFQVNETNATSLTEVYGYLYLDSGKLDPAPVSTSIKDF